MTLPSQLFIKQPLLGKSPERSLPLRSLTSLRFKGSPTIALGDEDGNTLYCGTVVDGWLWMVSQMDCTHPLYKSFTALFCPTFSGSYFTEQMKEAQLEYGGNMRDRVEWLWNKMHEEHLLNIFLARFADTQERSPGILDEVFALAALYIDPTNLHRDRLWMAWWSSFNGAHQTGGEKVLENLCLSGQYEPIPKFVLQTPELSASFFERMNWDTIVVRQIFKGVFALAQHFNCDTSRIIEHKGLVPVLGQSLLDRPKQWDKLLASCCTHQQKYKMETTLYWFAHHLARDRNFLFFYDTHQNQWKELQRRGFAPSVSLKDIQQLLSDILQMDLRTEDIPYEYRSERILTAVAPIIEKSILSDALKSMDCEVKNAPISRRKM